MIRGMEGKPPEPYATALLESSYCSFCGKGKSEVVVLVEGPAVFICDECVEKAQEIVSESRKHPRSGI